jgi:hypothetical protein
MKMRLFAAVPAVVVAIALVCASVAAADVSETSSFAYTGTNSCTGEAFSGTGNLRFTLSDSLGADGFIHHHLSSRIDGLQAVALVSGKKYVVQDTYFDEFNFVGANEETFDVRVHYIRQGEDGSFVLGDDFYEWMHTHITTNSLGAVTAFQVSMSDDPCQ